MYGDRPDLAKPSSKRALGKNCDERSQTLEHLCNVTPIITDISVTHQWLWGAQRTNPALCRTEPRKR